MRACPSAGLRLKRNVEASARALGAGTWTINPYTSNWKQKPCAACMKAMMPTDPYQNSEGITSPEGNGPIPHQSRQFRRREQAFPMRRPQLRAPPQRWQAGRFWRRPLLRVLGNVEDALGVVRSGAPSALGEHTRIFQRVTTLLVGALRKRNVNLNVRRNASWRILKPDPSRQRQRPHPTLYGTSMRKSHGLHQMLNGTIRVLYGPRSAQALTNSARIANARIYCFSIASGK